MTSHPTHTPSTHTPSTHTPSTHTLSEHRAGPLVVVFLRGGMDGLSLLRPLEDPQLDRSRGASAVPTDSTIAVGDGFGLHPALVRTAGRFEQGTVALIPACGLPAASRSHFEAQFAVESATGDTTSRPGTAPSGWLGRHLDHTGGDVIVPFRGVSLGQPQVPVTLTGSADVIAARSLADLALDGDHRGADPSSIEQIRGLWEGDRGPLGPSADAAFEVLRRLEDRGGSAGGGRTPQGTDPGEQVGDPAVEQLVSLFGSGLGTEVAVLNVGGWDDHDALGAVDGAFATRAGQLDSLLDGLLTGIPDVTVLALSEFGRRVATNDSGGCDHGRGGVVVLAGPRVHGGIHGDWPGLDDLDDGDVRITTDVRGVFARVLDAVLGGDPERVLPGAPDGPATLFD